MNQKTESYFADAIIEDIGNKFFAKLQQYMQQKKIESLCSLSEIVKEKKPGSRLSYLIDVAREMGFSDETKIRSIVAGLFDVLIATSEGETEIQRMEYEPAFLDRTFKEPRRK